jgi:hypothetical protein
MATTAADAVFGGRRDSLFKFELGYHWGNERRGGPAALPAR